MRLSQVSLTPSQKHSLLHFPKFKLGFLFIICSLPCFSSCQFSLSPPSPALWTQEMVQGSKGVARAGSHTMALFSSRMRSYHVTSLFPLSRETGDSEIGLGSDAWGRGGGEAGRDSKQSFIYLPVSLPSQTISVSGPLLWVCDLHWLH
jgi:hypothetical protein